MIYLFCVNLWDLCVPDEHREWVWLPVPLIHLAVIRRRHHTVTPQAGNHQQALYRFLGQVIVHLPAQVRWWWPNLQWPGGHCVTWWVCGFSLTLCSVIYLYHQNNISLWMMWSKVNGEGHVIWRESQWRHHWPLCMTSSLTPVQVFMCQSARAVKVLKQ